MAEIHILNVGQGDCIIFKSGSGRVTVFDVCGGNTSEYDDRKSLRFAEMSSIKGNFGMCKYPTNPLIFLEEKMHVSTVFRFILSPWGVQQNNSQLRDKTIAVLRNLLDMTTPLSTIFINYIYFLCLLSSFLPKKRGKLVKKII